jgi:hypothetical protein
VAPKLGSHYPQDLSARLHTFSAKHLDHQAFSGRFGFLCSVLDLKHQDLSYLKLRKEDLLGLPNDDINYHVHENSYYL